MSGRKRLKKTNLFHKDIHSLLYAYGDVAQPLNKTVQCLDELVSSYLVDICTEASMVASSKRNKIRVEDFKFVLRKDPVKLARAEELISTNALITEAKKQFNENDNQNLRRYKEDEEEDDDEDEEEEDEEEEEVNVPNTDIPPVKEKKKRRTKKQKTK